MNLAERRIDPASYEIFSQLTMGERRILRILGQKRELNLVKIESVMIKKRYRKDNFERWGIKNRLEGIGKFKGLIPYGFVSKTAVNKKETKYHLTFKGILAVAFQMDFKSIYQIEQFKNFLIRKGCDEKIARLAIEFIEYEIAIILTYHTERHYDWTFSKRIEQYWNDFKKYDAASAKQFFDFTDIKQGGFLLKIHRKYLQLFFALDKVTKPIICVFNNPKIKITIPSKNPIRNYIDKWYLIIESVSIGKQISYKTKDKTEEKILDIFFKECKKQKIEARNILKQIK